MQLKKGRGKICISKHRSDEDGCQEVVPIARDLKFKSNQTSGRMPRRTRSPEPKCNFRVWRRRWRVSGAGTLCALLMTFRIRCAIRSLPIPTPDVLTLGHNERSCSRLGRVMASRGRGLMMIVWAISAWPRRDTTRTRAATAVQQKRGSADGGKKGQGRRRPRGRPAPVEGRTDADIFRRCITCAARGEGERERVVMSHAFLLGTHDSCSPPPEEREREETQLHVF